MLCCVSGVTSLVLNPHALHPVRRLADPIATVADESNHFVTAKYVDKRAHSEVYATKSAGNGVKVKGGGGARVLAFISRPRPPRVFSPAGGVSPLYPPAPPLVAERAAVPGADRKHTTRGPHLALFERGAGGWRAGKDLLVLRSSRRACRHVW